MKLLRLSLLLLCGCGPAVNGTWRGPALVTLGGRLTLKDGLNVGSGVRLAIAWYPDMGGETPTPPRAIVTEEVEYTGSFPQNFTFPLFAPPPKAALQVVRHDDGSEGEAAVGQLLAYEDLDGDGQLTVDAQGHSGDRILGSTAGAGPFDFFSSEQRDVIAWVKKADDLGFAEQGMKPGYNLLRATSPFEPVTVLPLDTAIPLQMTGDPRMALIVCPEAYAEPQPEQACGVTVWATPAVSGTITMREDGALDAFIVVQAGGQTTGAASVTINGIAVPVDDAGFGYMLTETTPSVLRVGQNVIEVELAGYQPLQLEATVPGRFELSAPATVRAGTSIDVSWTVAAGATQYSASLFVESESSPSTLTSETRSTLLVPNLAGAGLLTVTAYDRISLGRSSVLGLSERSVMINVVP